MKLSAYIVRVDSGFSPNPFFGVCTLACGKPAIRRNADVGDIVVGTGAKRAGLAGRLIYAMRIDEVLPYDRYWRRFLSKRPVARTEITRRGDNLWHRVAGQWRGVPGALHDETQLARDIGGRNALVAREFYYFGRDAILIPARFRDLLATTQGHKNTSDPDRCDAFWDWVRSAAGRRGRLGLPSEFTELGCERQRTE